MTHYKCNYLPQTIFHFFLIDFQLNKDFPSEFRVFSPSNHLALLKDWFLKKNVIKEHKTCRLFFAKLYAQIIILL